MQPGAVEEMKVKMRDTQVLHDLGQSVWLDNITRDLLNSGMLKRYIRAWNLDEHVRTASSGIQNFHLTQRARGVVGQQGRYLQRYPAIHSIGLLINRPGLFRRASEVVESQIKKEFLSGLPEPKTQQPPTLFVSKLSLLPSR